MKLRIITPLSVPVEEAGIVSVRAEDESGGFGILQGAADLLTSLVPTVVSWKRQDGTQHYCAVRHGELTVSNRGDKVDIATREAVPGADLATLGTLVQEHFREKEDLGKNANVTSVGLQLAAIRLIAGRLRPDGHGVVQ